MLSLKKNPNGSKNAFAASFGRASLLQLYSSSLSVVLAQEATIAVGIL